MADSRIGAGGIKISTGDLCTGKSRENNSRNPTMMTICQSNTETKPRPFPMVKAGTIWAAK